jgi:hypothetical protein
VSVKKGVKKKREKEKVSVNGIDIFLLEAQDAAGLASYEWNRRARFITSGIGEIGASPSSRMTKIASGSSARSLKRAPKRAGRCMRIV